MGWRANREGSRQQNEEKLRRDFGTHSGDLLASSFSRALVGTRRTGKLVFVLAGRLSDQGGEHGKGKSATRRRLVIKRERLAQVT